MILDLRNALAQATEKIKSDAAIYDEYVKKDFKRPCFFLRLLKLTGRREMAGRYLFTAFWQIKYYPRLPVKGEPWRLYRELNDLALAPWLYPVIWSPIWSIKSKIIPWFFPPLTPSTPRKMKTGKIMKK